MPEIIDNAYESIVEACKRFRVRHLYLFGSALHDDFDPAKSDIDFLVEFEPLPVFQHGAAYLGLQDELFRILETSRIDLVSNKALKNPYFAQEVNRTKQELYAA